MQCRMWRDAANYEKGLRGPDCFYIHFSNELGFYNINRITQSPIKPFIAIVYINNCHDQEKDVYIRDIIYKSLPTNCKTLILDTCYSLLYNNKYQCGFNDFDYDIVCTLLPQISNGQLSMVVIENRETCTEIYKEYLQIIETARQNQESSMCLMLFFDYNTNDLEDYMVDIAKSRFDNNERVSFCGCVVSDIEMKSAPQLSPFYPLCVALFITGSIQTWSVVLEKDGKKFAEKKLQKFKDQVQLQKHTVAFVFASLFYITNSTFKVPINIEAINVFRNLFPNVPLIGCSSYFEFGRDTANYEEILRPKSDQFEEQLIFMILTYN